MSLTVKITNCGEVKCEVRDTETREPYTLFLVDGAEGEFVGRVREEYTRALEDIANNCLEKQIFKGAHTAALIGYALKKYGGELEFLWEDTPDCAVLRRGDTKKWYAAILTVEYRKLGLDRDERVEAIDMRTDPAELDRLVDNETYFRGWHMNKKRWMTMLLDGSAPYEELIRRLDASYLLAVK